MAVRAFHAGGSRRGAALLFASVLFLFGGAAEARIGGMSSLGCSGCHASNEPAPDITLDLPANMQPNERIALRLTISAPNIRAGGFYLETESGEGTFEAGPGSKLSGRGLTHSIRQPATDGAVTLDFFWTAPNEKGASRFRVSAIASNANSARSGDIAGDILADVSYGCTGVELYRDFDGDGFGNGFYKQLKCGLPEGFSADNTDCNDNKADVYPGAQEQCNQRDDNCNGEIDEGTEQIVFYLDEDGDGHGVPGQSEVFVGCAARDGLAPNDDDCDDQNGLRYPGAVELCNGVDDSCDDEVDEGLLVSCGLGACQRTTLSCFDLECIPGLPEKETCNGIDDDCNGFVDDALGLCPSGEVCGEDSCIPDPNSTPASGGAGGEWGGAEAGAGGVPAADDGGVGVTTGAQDSGGTEPKPHTARDASAGPSEPEAPTTASRSEAKASAGCSLYSAMYNRGNSGLAFLSSVGLFSLVLLRRRSVALRRLALLGLAALSGACGNDAEGTMQRDCTNTSGRCSSLQNDAGVASSPTGAAKPGTEGPSNGASPDAGFSSDADAAPGPQACVDECRSEAIPSCADGQLRSCWKILDQCAFWNESACSLGTCTDETTCTRCNHACDTVGSTGCRNGVLGVCVQDDMKCRQWEAQSTCSSGFCGDDGQCGVCQPGCNLTDPPRCVDGKVSQCVTDAFGCLSWSKPSPCALGYCAGETSCPAGSSIGQRGSELDDEFLALTIDAAGATAAVGGNYDYSDFAADARTTDAYLSVRNSDDQPVVSTTWGSSRNDLAVAVGSIIAGEYYVAGWTEGAMDKTLYQGGRDAFISRWKTGNASEVLWTRQWGSAEHDLPRALSVDAQGDVVVFGSTLGELAGHKSSGGEDLMLARWDAVGNRLWLKQWGTPGQDVGMDVVLARDGSVFVVGRTSGTLAGAASSGATDAFLQKLDRDGEVLFSRQWGGETGDSAEALALADNGDVLVLGTTQGTFSGQVSSGGIDLHLSRWTPEGEQVWLRQWGTQFDDRAYDMAIGNTGKIYGATSLRAGALDCPLGQARLVIWDTEGALLHKNLWDTCERDEFRAVAVDGAGRVTLAGFTSGAFLNESRGGTDAILVTYNPPQ